MFEFKNYTLIKLQFIHLLVHVFTFNSINSSEINNAIVGLPMISFEANKYSTHH